jgi:hypothetical protein
LLVLSAVIGLIVSTWCWLTLVPLIQDGTFKHLPDALGCASPPSWWPLPVLTVAGLLTAFAVARMPGGGGGLPAEGLSAGAVTHWRR